ncbi:MAG: hypothetical protein OFPII_28370 [Osedax symbiont Rs1]|nr:MAG: hypothetical protein OFPII_28370 [Osedax symbiont Rs1]
MAFLALQPISKWINLVNLLSQTIECQTHRTLFNVSCHDC